MRTWQRSSYFLFAAGTLLTCTRCEPASVISAPYSAAFIDETRLVVFPFAGNSINIPLPLKPGALMYSSDGNSLYSDSSFLKEEGRGVLKISIKSTQVTKVENTSGFAPIYSLAVTAAEDKIVVSGGYRRANSLECGIFELNVAASIIRPVITQENSGCRYVAAWHDISLSPDGKQAVAGEGRSQQVMLIDLEQGTYRLLGQGLRAAWSPNGKWIALLDTSRSALSLIDTADLTKRRDLGKYDGPTLQWSPDSNYLLIWASELACAPSFGYFGTLEALNVQSGERIPIKSSRCKVNLMTAGWVSNEVIK